MLQSYDLQSFPSLHTLFFAFAVEKRNCSYIISIVHISVSLNQNSEKVNLKAFVCWLDSFKFESKTLPLCRSVENCRAAEFCTRSFTPFESADESFKSRKHCKSQLLAFLESTCVYLKNNSQI